MPKILLIDDDERVRETIKAFLENHGYVVDAVEDGTTGLEKLKGDKFDLIIMDLLMPGIHGFDLCGIIKKDERTKHIPVIAVSAVYKWSSAAVEIHDSGIDAFVEKPLNFSRLLEKVEELTPDQ